MDNGIADGGNEPAPRARPGGDADDLAAASAAANCATPAWPRVARGVVPAADAGTVKPCQCLMGFMVMIYRLALRLVPCELFAPGRLEPASPVDWSFIVSTVSAKHSDEQPLLYRCLR